jgi:hypothetical protein
MVLNGIENEIAKIGAIDFIDTSSGMDTMDTSNVGTIATTNLVSTVDSVEEKICECQWEVMNSGDIEAKIVGNDELIWW